MEWMSIKFVILIEAGYTPPNEGRDLTLDPAYAILLTRLKDGKIFDVKSDFDTLKLPPLEPNDYIKIGYCRTENSTGRRFNF